MINRMTMVVLVFIVVSASQVFIGSQAEAKEPVPSLDNAEIELKDALIILGSTDISSLQQARAYIEERGGRITHIYPTHILIASIPRDTSQQLVEEKEIIAIHSGVVNPSTVEKYGKTAVYAVEAWNNNFMGLAKDRGLVPSLGAPEPLPIKEDALTLPDEHLQPELRRPLVIKVEPLGAPFGATLRDTSEYMIGDITVGIILMESNGSAEPSTEDWTAAEESAVVSEIQAGMNWWAARESNAHLTFTYDIHYGVATKYEPISRPGPASNGQGLWIPEAMTSLGYTTYVSYFDNVHHYNGSIRDANNADWGFTIFVIDSSADTDGFFADGVYFAYAYLGGPFMVMTYDNDGYSIANMDAVTAHEMGHIFYALDEYAASGCTCTQTAGYLNFENQNCENTCPSIVACIMRGQVSPYTAGAICTYSRQQVGWRDTDSDNILDILDTYPDTSLTAYSPDPTTDNTPTYTGSATVVPYQNNNPYGNQNDITINTLNNVEYRVDSGSWTNTTASDAAFDEATENFTFTPSALADDTYTFEVRATNSVGNIESSYASDSLYINASDPLPPANLTASAGNQQVTLAWINSSDADVAGTMVRYRTDGTYPTSEVDGALACNQAGSPGSVGGYIHTSLTNGITYYYTAFAYDGGPRYSTTTPSAQVNTTPTAPPSDGGGGGGGCFIATAVYGTAMAEEVKSLSNLRDKYLLTNEVGKGLVSFYYKISPSIADFIKDKEILKSITRYALRPVIWFSKFLTR